MSDEAVINTPATPAADPAPATPAAEPNPWADSPIAKVWNPDGTPREDAADQLKALGREDLAGFALRNSQDLFRTLESGRESQAALRTKTEGTIIKPGEDATDEQRAAYAQSLGALTKAEDYGKAIWPEDLPEGFAKDEKLAGIASEWAARHPVNTPEAVRELAGEFVKYQSEAMQSFEQKQAEEGAQRAQETKAAIQSELGGPEAFDKFSRDAKSFLTGDEAKRLGFEFKLDAEGKAITENPLHAAMLSDPAFLRLLKGKVSEATPARMPGQPGSNRAGEASQARRTELSAKHSAGTITTSEFAELKALREASLKQR